jgi:hypothetical protein
LNNLSEVGKNFLLDEKMHEFCEWSEEEVLHPLTRLIAFKIKRVPDNVTLAATRVEVHQQ